jgi:hypothetical protein
MKSTDTSNSRKVLLINPKFQLTFMGFVLGLISITLGIFYGSQLYFFWKFRQVGLSVNLSPDHVFFQFLNQQKVTMNLIFLFSSGLTAIILGVAGLTFSNRIAGPIYRLHQHLLKTAKTGKYSEITFREKDFFPEIAHAYNQQLPNQDHNISETRK